MCVEAVPWHRHRSVIPDTRVARGRGEELVSRTAGTLAC